MSMVFRTIGALSRTLAQAMAPAAVFILALVIYTGFTVPIRDMHPCKYSALPFTQLSLTLVARVPVDQLLRSSSIRIRSSFN